MEAAGNYSTCEGVPVNEDKLCSDIYPWEALLAFGYKEHVCYFTHHVGDWCNAPPANC